MSDRIELPFKYTDDSGNYLVLDRDGDDLTFRIQTPDDTELGPHVRVHLHSAAVFFTHLIVTATAVSLPQEEPGD